jgi:hypothetical protein
MSKGILFITLPLLNCLVYLVISNSQFIFMPDHNVDLVIVEVEYISNWIIEHS